ncbi:MAG TPA: LysR family transcriptional regulator [Acidimicrobiales bacterium]|jgi:DNA-binding transcriptional LysR family regulator|nr:LysR family transcriptional regulator [Acidimicrobiales bacterium]
MIDRRLQTLRAVQRCGTVTAAAEALHLTPSAASQQLRQLSADLGVALLEPHGRNVRLTDAAVRLVDHADALFARWEEARADLARRGDTTAGTLRICGFPTAVARLVAPAAARLQTTCPELSVRVSEVETDEGFDLLLADEADIAVVAPTPSSPPPSDPRFDQELLLDDELQHLLVPATHALAGRDTVALADAAHEPWIVPPPGSCDWYDLTLVACASAGFTPAIAHHAKEWVAVSALVGHGLGVALVPRLATIPPDDPVARVPISGQQPPARRIVTCVRGGSRDHPHIRRGLDALGATAPPVR